MEIPQNLIRNSPYLVLFEIRQKRVQNEELKGQKKEFEGARQTKGAKRG